MRTIYTIQSTLDISKACGLVFTSSNYPKCKLICTSDNLDLLKSIQRQIMVEESNHESKCIFDLDRCFEFRKIRDIRARDIESRL